MQTQKKVSANITKLLNEQTFSFSPAGLAAIHGRIFEGVFKFAGPYRNCNISKKEWGLRGESVLYVSFAELKQALQHDFDLEKEFSCKNLVPDDMISHFAKFISGIRQIHPFREGNTRTTAVFAIKYLRAWVSLSATIFLLNTPGTFAMPLFEQITATVQNILNLKSGTSRCFSAICCWEKTTS